jgi:hypothetical protein
VQRLAGQLKYEALASRLFDDAADSDQDGAVDAGELYILCLSLYSLCTQYLPQVLTPPPRSQTDSLFKTFDLDRSGHLDREEFLLLASVFVENCGLRIAAQSSISLLLAPLAAAKTIDAVAAVEVRTEPAPPPTTRFFGLWKAAAMPPSTITVGDCAYELVPKALQPYVGNRGVATTGTAALLVATIVPAVLSLIDEYYLLRAARKTSRALQRDRRRRSTLKPQQ